MRISVFWWGMFSNAGRWLLVGHDAPGEGPGTQLLKIVPWAGPIKRDGRIGARASARPRAAGAAGWCDLPTYDCRGPTAVL
jgi:hypothetical protein